MTEWNKQRVMVVAGRAREALANVKMDVQWKSVALVPTKHGPLAELEVQMHGCLVRADKLASDSTVHHLSTVLAKPVVVKNTTGVVYGVLLEPKKRLRVPDKAELTDPPGRFMVPFGVGVDGPVWVPLKDVDTLLVAGTRGFGKSTFLNVTLASLLANHSPDELQVALIDPKVLELSFWRDAPHLLMPVARDDEQASAVLGRLNGIIQERISLFDALRVRDLDAYNRQVTEPLPRVLLVIDELAEVKAGLESLESLMRLGRALGVHVILSTQYPNAEVVAAQVRANVLYRVAFHLPHSGHYRVALQASTGEKVPQPEMRPGRMVVNLPEVGYRMLQAFWLSDDGLKSIAAEIAAGKTGGGLTEAEVRMVQVALSERDGYLSQAEIAAALGIKQTEAEKLSRQWQEWGWLAKDKANKNKCKLTGVFQAVLERSSQFQQFSVPAKNG